MTRPLDHQHPEAPSGLLDPDTESPGQYVQTSLVPIGVYYRFGAERLIEDDVAAAVDEWFGRWAESCGWKVLKLDSYSTTHSAEGRAPEGFVWVVTTCTVAVPDAEEAEVEVELAVEPEWAYRGETDAETEFGFARNQHKTGCHLAHEDGDGPCYGIDSATGKSRWL